MQSVRQAHSQRHPAQDAHDGARGAPVQVPVLREDVEDGGEPGVPREGAQGGETISVSNSTRFLWLHNSQYIFTNKSSKSTLNELT